MQRGVFRRQGCTQCITFLGALRLTLSRLDGACRDRGLVLLLIQYGQWVAHPQEAKHLGHHNDCVALLHHD